MKLNIPTRTANQSKFTMKLMFWMMFAVCFMLAVAAKKHDTSKSSHSHSDSSHSHSDEMRTGNRNNVTGECLEGYTKNLNGYCAPVLIKPSDTVPVPLWLHEAYNTYNSVNGVFSLKKIFNLNYKKWKSLNVEEKLPISGKRY